MGPSEDLSIDTPEQIALEFSVAGIGSRMLAMAIDSLIQLALYFLVVFALVLLLTRTSAGRSAAALAQTYFNWVLAIAIFLFFCIYWGYFAAFEVLHKGQTPGKWSLKIRVIKDNGRPINAFEGIGRNMMRVIDYLPTFYGVGLVTMALTRKNQRLGDLVAGTIVVHERVQAAIRPAWIGEPEATPAAPILAPEVARLDARDLQLVEAFLHRRHQLEGFVRLNAADQIVAHLHNKGNVSPQEGEGPETFLERIARTLRDHAQYSGPGK